MDEAADEEADVVDYALDAAAADAVTLGAYQSTEALL
jgi:hypothetical protein